MLATLQAFGLAIPGANYALLAWRLLTTYWKPIAIAFAVAYAFHAGTVHERKKHDFAQMQAQLTKVTFERDNLKAASAKANAMIAELDTAVADTREQINALRSKPVEGDCILPDDTRNRLRAIGAPRVKSKH